MLPYAPAVLSSTRPSRRDSLISTAAEIDRAASHLDIDIPIFYRLKNAGPAKQEQARLEVENAEDDLVQKTEVAITMMKAVLDNPEPVKNINELVKAQLNYFAAAADALKAKFLGIVADFENDSMLFSAQGVEYTTFYALIDEILRRFDKYLFSVLFFLG